METEFHYRPRKNMPLYLILSQIKAVHIWTSYLFNIILPSTPIDLNGFPLLSFLTEILWLIHNADCGLPVYHLHIFIVTEPEMFHGTFLLCYLQLRKIAHSFPSPCNIDLVTNLYRYNLLTTHKQYLINTVACKQTFTNQPTQTTPLSCWAIPFK